MAVVQLQRDPFARATLMRERVDTRRCAWCGDRRGRFAYWWESDSVSGRLGLRDDKTFCSVGCWRDYYGYHW